MTIWQFLSYIGLPSAVVGFGFTIIIRMLNKQNKRNELRDKNMFLLIKLAYTGVELSEATAISYKNNRCNGEISSALIKAQSAKCDYNDFIMQQNAQGL